MEKQNLKSLLENIYHLLAEDDDSDGFSEGDPYIDPHYPPNTLPRHLLSWYDTSYQSPGFVLPIVGPWNGEWRPGFRTVWPPWRWPTGQLPPGDFRGSGFGGRWVQSPEPNPSWPFPQGYYYVYPPGPDGLFPVWLWDGKQFVEQVPSWGCTGDNCWGGGGAGG